MSKKFDIDFTNLPVVIPYEVPDGIVVPKRTGVRYCMFIAIFNK